MPPRVTVLMSVYNGLPALRAAIESILAQSYPDFELLVIDDGSTDGSGAFLDDARARDPRVRVIHQENRGLSRSLDRGLREARGELIARHDADDMSAPERLERQVAFFDEHPEIVVLGTAVRVLDKDGGFLWDALIVTDEPVMRSMLRVTSPLYHGSVMMRREAALAAGGYRHEPHVEDILLWRALARRGGIANLDEPLYAFRLSPTAQNNVTRELAARKRAVLAALADAGDGEIPPQDLAFLESISGQLDPRTRRFQYHLSLARGLVRRGVRGRALREGCTAIRLDPRRPEPYLTVLLAFLPGSLRRSWFDRRERRVGKVIRRP